MSNAIETIDNNMISFIMYCLNCIRRGRNAMNERGLRNMQKQNPSDVIEICMHQLSISNGIIDWLRYSLPNNIDAPLFCVFEVPVRRITSKFGTTYRFIKNKMI